MVVLGVILLLLGAGGGALAVIGARNGSGQVVVEALGFTRQAGALELIAYGVAAALLFCLGWALVAAAARRRSRLKREERERAHIAQIERRADDERAADEQRWAEAGRRDEDFSRREKELSARHDGLDSRERDLQRRSDELGRRDDELRRRESEWRERQGPSVADVVTGRAEGNVHEGTASWVDPDSRTSDPAADTAVHPTTGDATQEMPRTRPAEGGRHG